MRVSLAAAFLVAMLFPSLTDAQTAEWAGEGSFNAGVTTGNTETTDVGLALKLSRDTQIWKQALEASGDFGETDGIETRNRIFLAGQVDRQLTDRLSGYARLSYERDEFSTYDSRQFAGVGLGYDVFLDGPATWHVEAGPGFRRDELSNGENEDSLALRLGSQFAYDFNDNVAFSNDTNLVTAERSTGILNTTALTATLFANLSARVSFEVDYDTDPLTGFEGTNTATKFSLVYGFGSED